MKTSTKQTHRIGKSLLTCQGTLVRLGTAIFLCGLLALKATSAVAGACGSSQPSNVSDTCSSVTPPCNGQAPCTRVFAGRPLWCKYALNGNCLTRDWWDQGGVQTWQDVYHDVSNFCSASCVCGPYYEFTALVTVYETTYQTCSGGS